MILHDASSFISEKNESGHEYRRYSWSWLQTRGIAKNIINKLLYSSQRRSDH